MLLVIIMFMPMLNMLSETGEYRMYNKIIIIITLSGIVAHFAG